MLQNRMADFELIIFSEASTAKLENLSDGWMPKICNIYTSPRLEEIGADLDGWIEPINLMHASTTRWQTWNLSKILHRWIFRLKILHRQFHLISTVLVGKNAKNEWKWRNLHSWQKFYTATGSDGSDKFHLCFLVWLIQVWIKRWCTKIDKNEV